MPTAAWGGEGGSLTSSPLSCSELGIEQRGATGSRMEDRHSEGRAAAKYRSEKGTTAGSYRCSLVAPPP